MAIRMANAFRCACTAVFVKKPGANALSGSDQERLASNMKLAEQLGAKVEIVPGEDVAFQIAQYVRLSGATKIVLGRSMATRGRLWNKPSITDRLIQLAPGIEIHILPDGEAQGLAAAHQKALHLLGQAADAPALTQVQQEQRQQRRAHEGKRRDQSAH